MPFLLPISCSSLVMFLDVPVIGGVLVTSIVEMNSKSQSSLSRTVGFIHYEKHNPLFNVISLNFSKHSCQSKIIIWKAQGVPQ